MDLGLKGKVALVAGASKGLGFAVAQALAAEGALVSIASRDAQAIADAAKRIESATGSTVMSMAVDVRDRSAIDRWVAESADRFGGVDALMTNSGGPPAGAAVSFDDQAWQDAAELLLFSTIRMVRAAVPHMERRGAGAILVSTSSSVKEPIQNLGLSTVLRASVSALAKTLAIELAAKKIRVNQIIPGRIDTDRVRQLDEINAKKQGVTPDEAKAKAMGAIPLGRYGETDARRTVERPRFWIGSLTDDDVDMRIAPPPRASIHGTADRTIRIVLKSSNSAASCHAASSNDIAWPAGGPPELVISASIPPKRSTVAATHRWIASADRTSTGIANTSVPVSRWMRAAAARIDASSRDEIDTFAPSCASALATP